MTQASRTQERERVRGCLLAGAIGDAMGGPFEGQPGPIRFRERDNWKISDDTQLTLATCESIIELSRVSPEHIAARFLHWFRERRITGIGSSTLKAMRDLDAGAHWALAGAKGEMSAGNGAAMRIAPLAFHLETVLRNAIEAGGDTDTIASIAGQIAGAWIGASQIPIELISSLPTGIKKTIDEF